MNAKQKLVLLIIIVLLALMGLVPPWQQRVTHEIAGFNNTESTSYRMIATPPAPNYRNYPKPYQTPEMRRFLRRYTQVTIDMERLGVQWATVLFVGIGLLFLLQDRRRELAPKNQLSYLERMKRAGALGGQQPVPEMALDDDDLMEKEPPKEAPKPVFSDDDL